MQSSLIMQKYLRNMYFVRSVNLSLRVEDYYHREISILIYPALKDTQIKNIINTIFEVFDGIN